MIYIYIKKNNNNSIENYIQHGFTAYEIDLDENTSFHLL